MAQYSWEEEKVGHTKYCQRSSKDKKKCPKNSKPLTFVAVLGTGLEVKGKKTYLSGIWTHLPNMIGQENSGV